MCLAGKEKGFLQKNLLYAMYLSMLYNGSFMQLVSISFLSVSFEVFVLTPELNLWLVGYSCLLSSMLGYQVYLSSHSLNLINFRKYCHCCLNHCSMSYWQFFLLLLAASTSSTDGNPQLDRASLHTLCETKLFKSTTKVWESEHLTSITLRGEWY